MENIFQVWPMQWVKILACVIKDIFERKLKEVYAKSSPLLRDYIINMISLAFQGNCHEDTKFQNYVHILETTSVECYFQWLECDQYFPAETNIFLKGTFFLPCYG